MNAALAAACDALSLPTDRASDVVFVGDDELPSAFSVTDLASGTVAAAATAVSELVALQVGAAPAVTVDRRLASLWFGRSIEPVGWSLPSPWDAIAGDYRTADGWIRLHTNAPAHRAAALGVLGCAENRDAVAAAVERRAADELESAIVDAGGCAATMRSAAAWAAHPQGSAVAREPLIHLETTPSTSIPSYKQADAPLAGVRVLDLTRVLAGPVATRFLAGYGADVLRIDPPDWDEPALVPDVTLGKRCARLDLHATADRTTFEALLADADVLVHGFRPGALDALGYPLAARRAIRPELIDVSLAAYGWTGPWNARRGFDSLVQMSSGIAAAGMVWKGADRPTPLPVQALDHATGYLMAAAAVSAWSRRLRDGTITTARLSLARTATLLEAAGGAIDRPPWRDGEPTDAAEPQETTAWGPVRRVKAPADVAGFPMQWRHAAAPLGSSDARWMSGS